MFSEPLNHIKMSSKEFLEAVSRNCARIRRKIQDSENKIIFGMLDVKSNPLHETQGISNQLIILYKSGRFEVLPQNINGYNMKDYLGVRYNRITHWSVLPAPGSPSNPATGIQIYYSPNKDVYEC